MVLNSKFNKILYYNFPAILFSLLPFFLITGPFLSDLSISLITLIFLIYCFKNKNFSYFKNKYFYFFLFFWIYLVINSFINNFNLDSLKISFFYFRYGVFVIAIVALLNQDDKFVEYFFYCIFFCFTVLVLDGYFQYFNGVNILGWGYGSRITSFFGDEKILGSYLCRLWPVFFALSTLMLKKNKILFFLFILIFILSETLIFLSGDRAAFFFINLSAIFVILFTQKLFKLRFIVLTLSILLIVVVSFINPTAKYRVLDYTLQQMNLTDENKREQEGLFIFSKAHTHHYITAYNMFLDNKILGVGVKNFRNFCSDEKYKAGLYSCASHPHNSYIQILAETGIIGFLFLILILFVFCKFIYTHALFKMRKKAYFNDFEICLLSGIAMYLWPFIPTGNIFNNWLNIAMLLNLPFFIWSRKLIKT